MSIKYVNIQGQKKIRLDKVQFMDCWDIGLGLAEAGLQFPEGTNIYDLFPEAKNGSYEYLDLNYCAEFEEDIINGYHRTDKEIKKYQAHKVLEIFFKKYTDLVDPNGIYIYISW